MKLLTIGQVIKETKHAHNTSLTSRLWKFACLNKMDIIECGNRCYFNELDAKKLVALLDEYAYQHPKNLKKGL